jgi:hypothetical protein
MPRSLIASMAVAGLLSLAGSAHGAITVYDAFLSGPNESPANASPGTGFATVTIDDVLNQMTVDVTFSGLLGTTTASHIHCCTTVADTGTAGVATTTPTFPGFPLGVTSGSYLNTFDLGNAATYNPAFVTAHTDVAGAEAALLAGLASDKTYLNIHTTVVAGGEIRGFLHAAVPEPETWALMILGFGLAGAGLRRRPVRPAA